MPPTIFAPPIQTNPVSNDDEESSTAADSAADMQLSSTDSSDDPVLLEGSLMFRKGGRFAWRRRFVVFNFENGGSITVFKDAPEYATKEKAKTLPTSALRTAVTRLQKSLSGSPRVPLVDPSSQSVDIEFPADMPWVAKDLEHDPSTFVVEIPYDDDSSVTHNDGVSTTSSVTGFSAAVVNVLSDEAEEKEDEMKSGSGKGRQLSPRESLEEDIKKSENKGKPYRVFFRCNRRSNEKALWLKAFQRQNRLSGEIRKKKGLMSALTSSCAPIMAPRPQYRRESTAQIARDTLQLDMEEEDCTSADMQLIPDLSKLASRTTRFEREREYRVQPQQAYPHRWMTIPEMQREMILPSEHVHDLRNPNCKQKEIGSLKVEVLQCLGLPKLDRTSETDAVVYLVVGSYAFSTDVIMNRANPMWLRKTRRACNFPLFHGYARLYVGVFDDNGSRPKDDFAGRVVVDLARLRPNSTYDVVLPLRLSTHVYSRRRRGAIRLRFTLNWRNEREPILSYLPKKLAIPLPQHSKPNRDVTVRCADHRAFRNIAYTVHGAHFPGRFTFQQMRAVIREINFTRKYIFTELRQHIQEVRQWENPAISAFIFVAWMHCIWENAFSLVPGYVCLYALLNMIRTYAKYGVDPRRHRGFIPPTWEELFMALANPTGGVQGAIEPLSLGRRNVMRRMQGTSFLDEGGTNYKVATHKPIGLGIFRTLGLLPRDVHEPSEHGNLEFPFASSSEYPRMEVRECLLDRKGDEVNQVKNYWNDNASLDTASLDQMSALLQDGLQRANSQDRIPVSHYASDNDGLCSDDAEDENFHPRRVVVKSGKKTISNAALQVGDMTGINTGLSTMKSSIKTGVKGVQNGYDKLKRSVSTDSDKIPPLDTEENKPMQFIETSSVRTTDGGNASGDEMDPMVWPDQNIDIEGPSTGKKLTDDLADIKDKMHEMTWHLFDDQTYVLKNPNAMYFGDSKKPEKRRKTDVAKQLDKLLGAGQHSHSNPFVSRLGLYVEPLIEAAYSFLCLGRAWFNATTWQDPILSFWISVCLGTLALILFVFPWRIFLFFMGWFLVGPQNWFVRIARERGYLSSAKKQVLQNDKDVEDYTQLPADMPLVIGHHRQEGNSPAAVKDVDPREVHQVVVPYGPLLYQRFYDWPPEPEHSLVKRVNMEDESERSRRNDAFNKRRTSFDTNSSNTRQANFLRRRIHRRSRSQDSALRHARGRKNTGDWSGSGVAAGTKKLRTLTPTR